MKIYVGGAIWRQVELAHMKDLVPLLRQPGVGYGPVQGDALIDRARGISASHFLRSSDADVHLSIDSDITGFTIEDVIKLCESAMTYDIVAGVYVCRSANRTFPTSYYKEGVRVEHAFDHTPIEVEWAATGFMAVHRRVFQKLSHELPLLHEKGIGIPAFYPFYLPTIYSDAAEGPIELSEDYAFCEKAKGAGFRIYIDPAIRLGHIGTYTYRLEDIAQAQVDPQPLAITREGSRWRVESLERETVNA